MVINILNWTLFIFLAIFIVIFYFSFWGFAVDSKNNNDIAANVFIFLCCLFSAFIFIPAQYIFKEDTCVMIWKTMSIVVSLSYILVLLFNKIKYKPKVYLWGGMFTLGTAIIPFITNISVSKSFPHNIDFNNKYSIGIFLVISFVIIIAILCVFFVALFSYINKIRKNLHNQNRLLSEILDNNLSLNSTFRKPYERMLREEILSIANIIDRRISEVLEPRNKKSTAEPNHSVFETKEIQHIHEKMNEMQKMLLSLYDKTKNEQIVNFDIIRDLNHFFATPFATIEANTELLGQTKGINQSHLNKINNSIQLCKCIVETYRESLSFSNSNNNIIDSLRQVIEDAYNVYTERNNKKLKPLDTSSIPDRFRSYNNHYLISIILPLFENAIQAAPNNTNIEVLFDDNNCTIRISNSCEHVPTIESLKTPGYSSKNNHTGNGIIIVQNLLSMKNRGALETKIENNKVIQIIKLNKHD